MVLLMVGRAKDMIISGGFNIYLSDLEVELEKDERVIQAAVIGIFSEQWGETPYGFVWQKIRTKILLKTYYTP